MGRNAYRILVGNPEGKRLTKKTKTYVDNLKMDLTEGVVSWRALVNTVMNLRVP
jgi:hypothetical protein